MNGYNTQHAYVVELFGKKRKEKKSKLTNVFFFKIIKRIK